MELQSVKEYMEAQGMLPEGPVRVLAACSGGADSVALLHLLSRMEGVELVCAHFNHCLRGAESERDEAFVRGLCAEWGITFCAGRGDVTAHAAATGTGLEEAARTLRYRFLEACADENGCERIATAHTADDNAETVLLHLIRGAGARGLSGIPPVRGRIIRPLLRVRRAEILDYLSLYGLNHVEDSSNESDDYDRNRLRHRVLPVLRELNPAAVEHICAAAELLRSDAAYLDALAGDFLDRHPAAGPLPRDALLALPEPVLTRVLARFCGGPGQEHVKRVLALLEHGRSGTALDLPGETLRLTRAGLCLGTEHPGIPQPRRELVCGGITLLPETGRRIRSEYTVFSNEIHNSFNTFYFPCERICGKITIASRAPGDRIRLEGRGCTKEVRRLYAEAGLSAAERLRRLVLSDEAGPIAVEGFPQTAERMRTAPGQRVLRIELL